MGRVVSPTPTPLSSGRVVPALVASYDMHGRAVGLFYTQPTGQSSPELSKKKKKAIKLSQFESNWINCLNRVILSHVLELVKGGETSS